MSKNKANSKLQNVKAVKQMLDGTHKFQTKKVFGYDKKLLMNAKITLNYSIPITIYGVYAPTATRRDKENEEFFKQALFAKIYSSN